MEALPSVTPCRIHNRATGGGYRDPHLKPYERCKEVRQSERAVGLGVLLAVPPLPFLEKRFYCRHRLKAIVGGGGGAGGNGVSRGVFCFERAERGFAAI